MTKYDFPPQKQDKKMCGMAQMYSWLTTLYGNSDDFNWSQFGLPTDKVRLLESSFQCF